MKTFKTKRGKKFVQKLETNLTYFFSKAILDLEGPVLRLIHGTDSLVFRPVLLQIYYNINKNTSSGKCTAIVCHARLPSSTVKYVA